MLVRVPVVAELSTVLGDTRAGVAQGLLNLGFELVCELVELIEVDPRPGSECMGNGFGRRVPARLCRLAEAGALSTP